MKLIHTPAVALKLFIIMPPALVMSLLMLIITGCEPGKPVIAIESPEAKISPMYMGAGSVFMKISNTGRAEDVLVGARAEIPGSVTELHDIQDGKMVRVEGIPIPPDGTVLLRPARHHIMIFKMPKDVQEGYEFTLVLMFKKSGEKPVSLKLTSYAPSRSNLHH